MAKHRTGHIFKRGANFYVRWVVNTKVFSKALRDDQGRPVTTRREAEDAQTKFMASFAVADEATALESIAAKLQGRRAELARLHDEKNPPPPIDKAWMEFVTCPNRPDTGESTMRQYSFQFAQFARWMGDKHKDVATLREVTKEIAETYATRLATSGISANTYNKHLNLLTLVFRVLKHKAGLTVNPWEDIQRKHLVTHSRRELTVDELKKVCQSATGELKTLFALGVYTGLRLGDCATLRWSDVDLTRGIIRRIPNKTGRRNPKPVLVPIHPICLAILAETPAADRGEYVLPGLAALYSRRVDLVTDLVQQHFESCGIKTHKPGTGKDGKRAVVEVGFHSLRHTFVSLCRESDAPLSVVESIVGHSSPAMTRHYTHTGQIAASKAVGLLPSVINGAKMTVPTPPERDSAAILREAQRIAKSITAANWKMKRAKLLALVAVA